MRTVVWALPAMRLPASQMARTLGAHLMIGGYTGDCDVCHVVGLYDPPLYDTTLRMTARAKRRIIHWCGSDVLYLQDASVLPEATHVAESEGLARELYDKGIENVTVVRGPGIHKADPVPLLPDTPRIACYLGSDPTKYGNDMFTALSEYLAYTSPEIEVVGYMLNTYDESEMPEFIASCSAYVRLTAHDGSCVSAREFMEAGRQAVITGELPYATRVRRDDFPGLVVAVRKALEAPLDLDMAAYWKEQNSTERFVREMREVVENG